MRGLWAEEDPGLFQGARSQWASSPSRPQPRGPLIAYCPSPLCARLAPRLQCAAASRGSLLA